MAATRRLAAILAADVAGYSRLMGADEEGTHERLKTHRRELVDPKISEYSGRIVKTTGDGMLAEFPSVVDAVRCAAELQRAMIDREAGMPEGRRISFRIGINLGDVIVEDNDIFGDGVNVAARLEALAEPGGICISRTVRDQVRDKLPYSFEDLGEQSVKNIARPVRAYALSVAAVAALPAVAIAAAARTPAVPDDGPRLSIVVLPLVNLSSDPDQEYFTDGITDDLTTDLSRIAGSFVIARNTAFTYKGQSVDVKQIGRELGVRYVLEGSVRRTGDQVRVNVQLIDAETGTHIWADRFDTDRANLGQSQDEITGRLAATLNLELVKDVGRRIDHERAADPDARDFVMRGNALRLRPFSVASRQEALRAFERALEIDRESIDAKIGVAGLLVANLQDGWSRNVQQDEARAELLLLEALERDGNSARAHERIGVLRLRQNRLAEAKIELETAIALDRNHRSAFFQLGATLNSLGQPEAAIPYIEKAIRLSPYDASIPVSYMVLGRSHLLLGHVDEAIDFLRKARAANPRLYLVQFGLAAALGLKGDLDEARAALAEAIKINPELNSLARVRAHWRQLNNPQRRALAEKTEDAGLRRAGMPEE